MGSGDVGVRGRGIQPGAGGRTEDTHPEMFPWGRRAPEGQEGHMRIGKVTEDLESRLGSKPWRGCGLLQGCGL